MRSPTQSAAAPQGVRAPGVSVAGTKCDALVETLDLFPTLVDLCAPQFKQTAYPLDGHSLRRLLMGKTTPLRDAALSYWRSAVSVRTPTHRLAVGHGPTLAVACPTRMIPPVRCWP